MHVAKRGNKASDTFFSAIRNLENAFKVKADFIGREYIAVILGVKLRVVK